MKAIETIRRVSAGRGHRPLLGTVACALLLTACDTESLLSVRDPDIVPGEVVADTANIESLRNGVLYEFARALTGPTGSNNYHGVIGLGGVMSDEQWYSSTFTNMREIDARSVNRENTANLTVFRYVQRARNWAEVATQQYAASPRANTANHALVAALAGYPYIFLAENWCSGVPLSRTTLTGALEYGKGNTREELLNLSVQRFDQAITLASARAAAANISAAERAAATRALNLARVGRARALQNLGRFSDAAATAALVPSGFTYLVDYSANSSGQQNGVWGQINSSRRSSVASEEGTGNRGMRYFNRNGTTAAAMTIDPRAPIPSRSVGLGTGFPLFRQGKYPDGGADVPLATYVEAQLIVAENLLNRGNSAAYLPVLNTLRADAGLAPLTDPGNASGRIRQLYEERAFWLWLTGHRLGDLRRLVREYRFPANQVFPTGTTIVGRPYGDDVNLLIPFEESNNPEAGGGQCFNRDA